ncbi:MAG: MATE family efflux transporter [Oscillospiraceae bacterium]|nr:MATE family efflux transporter [Oscillospiraceae bacterium]
MEQNKILEGGLYKNIMLFFLPIWFGTFFQQLYNTVDAVIVGNFVGKAALAAVGGPTGTIINLLVNFFVGVSSGAGVVIAMYFGSRNVEKTDTAIHTAIAISVAGGLILMAIGIPFSPMFLEWMGTPADILEQATVYIRIYFFGAVFNLVYNIGSGILRAMGDSKKPLYFLIVASIVNIVLDVVFVVFLNMGVAGVGLATIIAQFSSAVLVILTLKGLPEDIALIWNKVKLNGSMCREIFRIGIPNGIQSIAFSISNIAIMSSINAFGTDTVAAWTAFGKIDAMFWMTVGSFGIATTTFVGQNFGAKNFDRVKKSVRACNVLSIIAAVMLSTVMLTFYPFLYRIFTQDAAVIEIGATMVKIMVPLYFTFVFIENFSGAMRGVGHSIAPTVLTIMGICVFRVFWIAFILPMNNTLITAIISYPISWCLTAVIFTIYYLSGIWFKKSVQKRFGETV